MIALKRQAAIAAAISMFLTTIPISVFADDKDCLRAETELLQTAEESGSGFVEEEAFEDKAEAFSATTTEKPEDDYDWIIPSVKLENDVITVDMTSSFDLAGKCVILSMYDDRYYMTAIRVFANVTGKAFRKSLEYDGRAVSIKVMVWEDTNTMRPLCEPKSLDIDPEHENEKYIVCWGDSLTAQGGWTTTLETLSGMTVYNAGTGGENAKTICARQGGDVMIINNITIPANTTDSVLIGTYRSKINTYNGNYVSPLLQNKELSMAHVNPCKIGDIEGTLSWTGSSYNDKSGTWVFRRNTPGDETVISQPTEIRTNYDMNKNSPYLMIIFMGTNGIPVNSAPTTEYIEKLIGQHKLMIAHSKAENVIILGITTGNAATRETYEAMMKKEFGSCFINLREYLTTPIYDENNNIISCYGIDDLNNPPPVTEDDITAISIGKVPPVLLKDDGLHYKYLPYNDNVRIVIGKLIYRKCCELGIF